MRALLAGTLERALYHPLRALPTPAVSRIGGWLGRKVAPALYPDQDALARAALRALRPGAPEDEALRAMWGNLGASFAEMARILRFWDEGWVEVSGAARLLAAKRDGPVLVAGLHLGNPEVLGLTLARLGLRPVGVATRQPTDFRERVITDLRLRGGGRMIRADRDAMRPALSVLRGGQETLLFWMNDYVRGRANGPSLGRGPRRAGNIPLAVRLARLSGCALVPGFVERLPGGAARFRTVFLPPVALPPLTGDRAADLAAGAAALDAVLDPVVRVRLEQWFFTIAWRPEEGGCPP
jgi:Kdo2-lipid IVA lauroyltransferase/acyltransferase